MGLCCKEEEEGDDGGVWCLMEEEEEEGDDGGVWCLMEEEEEEGDDGGVWCLMEVTDGERWRRWRVESGDVFQCKLVFMMDDGRLGGL
ncbi:hypothetical protein L1987_38085 [Smallanthus sonchifolius]|uniref:Uncharacterized protein n=1 Tax=Smallanthus sonchifolius TaxID=185202 RepID=A0ACB9HJI2_9ASTR|nr:hypothetical protein L1987_38085 [Smallanthus sonchifolius]